MSKARYVYGKNSVKTLMETHPERVFKVFLAEGLKPDKRVQAIEEAARGRKIPVQVVPRQKLDQMLKSAADQAAADARQTSGESQSPQPMRGSRQEKPARAAGNPDDGAQGPVHQGVLASVAPRALMSLPELIALCKARMAEHDENAQDATVFNHGKALRRATGRHPRVLLLDGVTDPRNFGAILRVADAAGIDGVIVPKHHGAGFGPAVSKTASGAEEAVNVAVVANLNNAIRDLKQAGFWIAGAAHEAKAVDYFKQDYDMPIALVMGSEDKGLGDLVRRNCDFLIRIPMRGAVESLNVATAAAVLLFEMVRNP